MKDIIRTVNGDISPEELGVVHAHEHTMIRSGLSSKVNPALLLDSVDVAVAELSDFKAAGGSALVDAQPIGVERAPRLMREISRRSGVKIIATTGFHRPCFCPDDSILRTENADRLAERIVSEIVTGMIDDADGTRTDVKAGIVKFTGEYHFIPPLTMKACEAAAIAHEKTGVPVMTHTELGTCGIEQIEAATKFGVRAESMILCHLDRNPDRYLHREIASTGAFLVYDGIARTKYWPDSTIIDLILDMIHSGYGNRIMLAMDVATRSIWRHYGGGPGLDYLLKRFIPRLVAAGCSPEDVHQMHVLNPAKAFAFRSDNSRDNAET